MKIKIGILLLFSFMISHQASATEAVVCSDDKIAFYLYLNLSDGSYGDFRLFGTDQEINSKTWKANRKTIDLNNRTIDFTANRMDQGLLLKVRGKTGIVEMNGISHMVECDWSAFD